MIKKYSLSQDGRKQLSENFRVWEFAQNDGADLILIDDNLVALLQKARDYFKCPININSGFRSFSYNRGVGSTNRSRHTQGRAADIRVIRNGRQVSPKEVAIYFETIGCLGVGAYRTFTHVDTRQNRAMWENLGAERVVSTHIPRDVMTPTSNLRLGDFGPRVAWYQQRLNTKGFTLSITGRFDELMDLTVKEFQRMARLTVDGVIGTGTAARL